MAHRTSIAPWLTVRDGERALAFYTTALGAVVAYRLEEARPGVVARLSVDGAEFWISDDPEKTAADTVGGGSIRMILTVDDPDAMFTRALSMGASEVSPVQEGYGWRVGRLTDPFGLDWEIGHPLA